MPSRREFLAGALALAATACTGGSKPKKTTTPPGPPTSIQELTGEGREISLLGIGSGGIGGEATDPLQSGTSVVSFDLTSGPPPGTFIENGGPQLYLATSESAPLLGPFPGTWSPFTGYAETGDQSPKSPIPGVYFSKITVPAPGVWIAAAVAPDGPSQGVGVSHVYVGEPKVAVVGSKATPVKTPVATSGRALREICTRKPPDPLHSISLSDALANGKPTVVVFSTPLLCQSQLCGPVTDEVILEYEKYGKAKANFIHVEEFLPGPKLKVPAPTLENQSPGFKAWGLQTEPWVVVVDKHGTIRARFEGPTTAPMIDTALKPLL